MINENCYNSEELLGEQISSSRLSMRFDSNSFDELQTWQKSFRKILLKQMGIMPELMQTDLRYLESQNCGSYTRHKVVYTSEKNVNIPAFILIPNNANAKNKKPAVLCIHGHGDFGKDSIVGLNHTEKRKDEVKRYNYDFGHKFAEEGYVVLAPDLRGFGERRHSYPEPNKEGCCDICNRLFMRASFLGTSVPALNICDLQAGISVLESLDFVDGNNIGSAGLSLGGRMCMLLSALDTRIKWAVPSGCMNSFNNRYGNPMRTNCGSQVIPGLLKYGDTPEIFSLITPRDLLIQVGNNDRCCDNKEWIVTTTDKIVAAYKLSGKVNNFSVAYFEGGHVFHWDSTKKFIDKITKE